jgi:hypothetical protein
MAQAIATKETEPSTARRVINHSDKAGFKAHIRALCAGRKEARTAGSLDFPPPLPDVPRPTDF